MCVKLWRERDEAALWLAPRRNSGQHTLTSFWPGTLRGPGQGLTAFAAGLCSLNPCMPFEAMFANTLSLECCAQEAGVFAASMEDR